ncbi:Beta-galactosidase [Microbacterium hydrocarbonoxydans]|uniref:Beta-galactosidase n=1 Tax=Microbacterium hydrocarbonoxydans TaxID=273678 RepID=A0A0M2HKG3_9MICO|nr:glycoside hydrolase family 2 TIM barrel-domain containing protein [Microbacterium hydrocarbonoxydans]KJL47217.1 Beta-galactosidase [Microbacterium hydrocarbonoxydans]
MSDHYWESTRPGAGRREPRADSLSDARVISLNGTWRFRLSPTASGTGCDFLSDDFDDSAWDPMPVPSHWVLEEFTPLAGGARRRMLGTAEGPLYTNTAYPIPLDPPRITEANPTGDYRLVFHVPEDFGRAVLRFQGVDSCAKVWLNGEELGWSTGSRLPFEFDAPVRHGRNVLTVRVHRWSAGTYLEDQDMWWLPGIFRDVELIERPAGAIDDHFVHADFDHETGLGTLRVDASMDASVEIPELGIWMRTGETAEVPVEPWSAESPKLYRGSLRSEGEVVDLAIGFRRVEIIDGTFTVNGRAVTFRGVNRHEHDPLRGRALDVETMRRDIVLMKRANIDAVRTSHYPPHPEFLRLCDELGLWVVLENDLETHGFIYDGWEHNPPASPEWREALLDRLRRTVERDKNRPSIVIWSLANESMTGDAFGEMRRWLDEFDPSRPVLYERDPTYQDSDFYSVMYPSLEMLEMIGRREEPASGRIGMHGMMFDDAGDDGVEPDPVDARRRGLPFLLVEYAHAMGNGPGSLSDYWRVMREYDRICGGFVWEWIDHGFAAETPDGTPYVMHGQDVDYEPNGGRYSLHGLVFSDRTPTPGLAELAKAYAPLRIEVGEDAVVIRNDRHTASTADLRFTWTCDDGSDEPASGELDVPAIAAGESATIGLDTRAGLVTVSAALAADAAWAPAGHVLAWGQRAPRHPPVAPLPTPIGGVLVAASEVRLGDAVFDGRSGRLRMLGDVALDGPWLDLHRAPTENDRGQGDSNNIAKVWQQTGLDRMEHRTDAVRTGEGWFEATGRTAPSAHPHGVTWTMLWQQQGEGLELTVTADFVGPWANTPYMHRDIWVPRLGLLLGLPGEYSQVEWVGRGPGESYADSFEASPLGRYRSAIDDLQVPYPVPQENGNHVDTRMLRLSGDRMPVLQVEGRDVFDFTARRWTSKDLQAASRPHELVDSGRVWLNVDHRQLGLGSASVGPATPERYRIPREKTVWRVRISLEE